MHDGQSEIGRQRREFREFLDRTAVYDAPARPGVTFLSFLPFFSGKQLGGIMGRMELISSYAWKKNDDDVKGKSVGQSEGRDREKSDKNGIETLIHFFDRQRRTNSLL